MVLGTAAAPSAVSGFITEVTSCGTDIWELTCHNFGLSAESDSTFTVNMVSWPYRVFPSKVWMMERDSSSQMCGRFNEISMRARRICS